MSPNVDPVILFDFDGVIADSFEAYFAVFTGVCAEMGYHRLNSKEAFLRLFEGNPVRRLLKAGFPVFRLKRLARTFAPRIIEAHRHVRAFDGMPEILRDLAARCPVYVITSNTSDTIEAFLRRYGIGGLRGILGIDHEASKVKKIKQIMRRHPGCRSYYIGDTKGDLCEARKAGAVPVAVAWGWHSAAKLMEGRPEHVAESPADLRALFLPTIA
jgi:phosphoglycolate phosphatase